MIKSLRSLIPDARDFFLAEWTQAILNTVFQNHEVGPLDQLFAAFWAVSTIGGMAYHISDIYIFYSLPHRY
jgi:hypothetical protein